MSVPRSQLRPVVCNADENRPGSAAPRRAGPSVRLEGARELGQGPHAEHPTIHFAPEKRREVPVLRIPVNSGTRLAPVIVRKACLATEGRSTARDQSRPRAGRKRRSHPPRHTSGSPRHGSGSGINHGRVGAAALESIGRIRPRSRRCRSLDCSGTIAHDTRRTREPAAPGTAAAGRTAGRWRPHSGGDTPAVAAAILALIVALGLTLAWPGRAHAGKRDGLPERRRLRDQDRGERLRQQGTRNQSQAPQQGRQAARPPLLEPTCRA